MMTGLRKGTCPVFSLIPEESLHIHQAIVQEADALLFKQRPLGAPSGGAPTGVVHHTVAGVVTVKRREREDPSDET